MGMHPAMRKHNEFNYADDCPPTRCPLAEQTRNRDHDSSDECEQASKQHNVTQEHTDARAFPRRRWLPLAAEQPVKHESFPSITFPVETKREMWDAVPLF
jgi:hypothetical protein